MRWNRRAWKETDYSEIRVVRRFSLFPTVIEAKGNWLEVCYILQSKFHRDGSYSWRNEKFASKEDYLKSRMYYTSIHGQRYLKSKYKRRNNNE